VEEVFPCHLAAERQRTAPRGHRLFLSAQLDLRLQQLVARAAVLLGLVRPVHVAASCANSGTKWSRRSLPYTRRTKPLRRVIRPSARLRKMSTTDATVARTMMATPPTDATL